MASENNGTFPTQTFSQNPTSPPLLAFPTMIPSPLSAFSRPIRDAPPPESPLLIGYSTSQLYDYQRRSNIDGYSQNLLLNELASQLLRNGATPQIPQTSTPAPPPADASSVLEKIRQSLLPDKSAASSPSLLPSKNDNSDGKQEDETKQANSSQQQEPVHRIRRRRHSAGGKKIAGKQVRGSSECSTDGSTALKVPKQEPMPVPPSPANAEEDHEQQMGTPDDPIIHSPPSVRISSANGSTNGKAYASGCSRQSSSNADATNNSNNSGDDDANIRSKACRVCGDTATGYNFNVITCESCKAFFRRNALRPMNDFKCPYSDDCEINAVSRRFCQKCRLKKCFDVGMKKEWILTEDQLRRRKNSRLNSFKTVQSSSPRPKAKLEEDYDRKREMPKKMNPGFVAIKKERKSPTEHLSGNDMQMPPISSGIQLPSSLNPTDILSGAASGLNYHRTTIDVPLLNPMIGINMQNVRLADPIVKQMNFFNPELEAMRNDLMNRAISDDAYEPLFLRLNQSQPLSAILPITTQPPPSTILPITTQPPPLTILPITTQPPPSAMLPIATQPLPPPAATPSFPASIETVVHKGEPKVALSIEEYQKLVKAAAGGSSSSSNATTPIVSDPITSTSGLDPIMAKQIQNMLQQQPNLLSGFGSAPADLSRIIGMANVEIMNAASTTNSPYASSSQQTSPGMPFTPEGLRKWRYMENIIHEALVNSPESSVNSPEAPAPVDREITYYQEIASSQAATNPMNAKYHLSPQDLRELDIVKNAFACMDEMVDVNSKEAATLKKKDHDPTDIMNIMDISMKRFVKMAKRLPAFLQMAQESKLALLRSSMIDMLTIRGVTKLDLAHRQWKSPCVGGASISFDMFDKLNDSQQKGRFLHFYRALHDKIRPDTDAINLIALLVLFDCSRANLSSDEDKKTSEKNQTKYYWLLKKYFESKYGDDAMAILQTVPEALSILRVVSTNAATLFLGRVKTDETEKLVTEFFRTHEKDQTTATSATPTTSYSTQEISHSSYQGPPNAS